VIADGSGGSNAGSHVNRIPGVTLDESGFIHTPYGSYHPPSAKVYPSAHRKSCCAKSWSR